MPIDICNCERLTRLQWEELFEERLDEADSNRYGFQSSDVEVAICALGRDEIDEFIAALLRLLTKYTSELCILLECPSSRWCWDSRPITRLGNLLTVLCRVGSRQVWSHEVRDLVSGIIEDLLKIFSESQGASGMPWPVRIGIELALRHHLYPATRENIEQWLKNPSICFLILHATLDDWVMSDDRRAEILRAGLINCLKDKTTEVKIYFALKVLCNKLGPEKSPRIVRQAIADLPPEVVDLVRRAIARRQLPLNV